MAEDKLVTSEMSIFFDETGHICMGGGLHIKLVLPGQPTVATIQALVDRVHAWRDQLEPLETSPEAQERPSKPGEIPGLPHCPRVGVWASARGNYKEGFKPEWKHNDPKVNTQGQFYCPTPIGKDKATGQLIWCTWRARELDDGTYEEYEVGAKE